MRDGTEEAAENEGEADDNNCGDRLNHVFRPTDVLSFGSVRVRVRACASTKAGLTSGHRPFFRGMVGMISTDKGCKKRPVSYVLSSPKLRTEPNTLNECKEKNGSPSSRPTEILRKFQHHPRIRPVILPSPSPPSPSFSQESQAEPKYPITWVEDRTIFSSHSY